MVATEHERHRAARGDLLHDRREARTGVEDLRQEAGALVLDRERLGLRCQDVPAVDDRASERREPLLESGVADRGRPHVDAAAALPEIERARRRSSRYGAWQPRQRRLPGRHDAVHAAPRRAHDRVASGMAVEREVMTWADLGTSTRRLAEAVAADGYDPDMILSIARGGLLVGAALGYALSVKNVYTMNVEYYTGVDERLEVPRILPPAPDFVDLQDARILIADDVADTGHTLESVQEFCAGKVGEVRIAVLYEKPHTVVPCDYVWRRTDRWIDFPWSAPEPVVVRTHAARDA